MESEGTSVVGTYELLIVVTSLVAEHRFQGARALVINPRLNSCGIWVFVALRHVGSFQIRD